MVKEIGKCSYCNDPIYDFQKVDVKGDLVHLHRGCVQIRAEEKRQFDEKKVG